LNGHVGTMIMDKRLSGYRERKRASAVLRKVMGSKKGGGGTDGVRGRGRKRGVLGFFLAGDEKVGGKGPKIDLKFQILGRLVSAEKSVPWVNH